MAVCVCKKLVLVGLFDLIGWVLVEDDGRKR